jgi:hypothetical protein
MVAKRQWNMIKDMSDVNTVQVFSGGACNIRDAEGNLLRNEERDAINDWLTDKGIKFFDPQIHPDTHGEEYVYHKHSKLEIAAREHAKINLYEVSPRTFGAITSFEIAADHFRYHEPTVIYYSDGNPEQDAIPAHSDKGYPLFRPDGIRTSNDSPAAAQAHYREFIKNANNMRKYLMHFAHQMNTLTVSFGERIGNSDIIVSPERMHAADIFRAVVLAVSGYRVMVVCTGGDQARDERGNPRFIAPENPPEAQLYALLDQYVDEGNALRKAIAELVEVSVYVRVVFTHRSAMQALEEVLRLKHLI